MLGMANAKERDRNDWIQLLKETDPRFVLKDICTPPTSELSTVQILWDEKAPVANGEVQRNGHVKSNGEAQTNGHVEANGKTETNGYAGTDQGSQQSAGCCCSGR